ncbi:MAG TPA: hypothetical protein VF119_06510 [Candidatus Limnocylindrales bacterium]
MSDQQVIVAIFDDEAAADAAVAALNAWEHDTVDMDLDAIGVLVADDDGRIKEHKLGRRSTGKGAGIGLVLAVIAPPTLLAGVVAGGIAGHFHHKGLGLTQADLDRLAGELTGGKAAVGIMADPVDAVPIVAKLKSLGGTVEAHDVSDEALEAVAAAAGPDPAAGPDAAAVERARMEAANTAPFRD